MSTLGLDNKNLPVEFSSKDLSLYWLIRGTLSGALVGFLVSLIAALISPHEQNIYFVFAMPFWLLFCSFVGLLQSAILWAITKLIRRHLNIFFRSIISLLFVLPFVLYSWSSFEPTSGAYHQPGRSLDGIASLKGIKRMSLIVEMGSTLPDSDPDRVSEAQIRNLVTVSLNEAGIEVVDFVGDPNLPILWVSAYFAQDPNQKEAYSSTIKLNFRQKVSLVRDPNMMIEATTWDDSSSSLVSGGSKKDNIQFALSTFTADYANANSDNFPAPDFEAQRTWKIKLSFIIFAAAVVLVGVVSGSSLRLWRPLAYGVPETPNSTLKKFTGIVLRSLTIFLLMESIFTLICLRQLDYSQRDYKFALIALAHCVLVLVLSFGRLKSAVLLSFALTVNLMALVFYYFRPASDWTQVFIVEYAILFLVFTLTRFTLTTRAISYFKKELRYYLID